MNRPVSSEKIFRVWIIMAVWIASSLVLTDGSVFAGSYNSEGRVVIVGKKDVSITGEQILLGQVARIESPDKQTTAKLSKIIICKAPALGESKWIDAGLVRLRLKQNSIYQRIFRITFNEPVRVTRLYLVLSPEKIRVKVRAFLKRALAALPANASVKVVQLPGKIRIPKGGVSLEVRKPKHVQLRGKFPLMVAVQVNGKTVKQLRVMAEVKLWARAVVTTRPLGKRQPITPDVVSLRKVNVTRCSRGFFTSLRQVMGMRSRSAFPVNSILNPTMLEVVPVVHRGDVVKMVAESRNLKITVPGICKEAGAPGQRIKVTNLQSRKDVYAEVIDSATVKVSF